MEKLKIQNPPTIEGYHGLPEVLTHNDTPAVLSIMLQKVNHLLQLSLEKESQAKPDSDKWFDKPALCAYIPGNPKIQTINTWIAQGKIPSHKQGKRVLFLKSEIDNWLKQGRRKTAAELETEATNYVGSKNKKG